MTRWRPYVLFVGGIICLWLSGCGSSSTGTSQGCPSDMTGFQIGTSSQCYPTCSTENDCSPLDTCRQGACVPGHLFDSGQDTDPDSSEPGSGNGNAGDNESSDDTANEDEPPEGSDSGTDWSTKAPLSCSQLVACTSECSTNSDSCEQSCKAKAPSSATDKFGKLSSCLGSQCNASADVTPCAENSCSLELSQCGAASSSVEHLAGSSGDSSGGNDEQNPGDDNDAGEDDSNDPPPSSESLNCAELVDCYDNCPDGDSTCRLSCKNRASGTAIIKYRSLQHCYETQCIRSPSPQTCIEQECRLELRSCARD
jgi:hypothetical protein